MKIKQHQTAQRGVRTLSWIQSNNSETQDLCGETNFSSWRDLRMYNTATVLTTCLTCKPVEYVKFYFKFTL